MPTPIYGSHSFTNIPDVNGAPVLLNGGGTGQIATGTLASRPSPGNTGDLFVDTTNFAIWHDTGSDWGPLSRVLNVYTAPGIVTTTTANLLALSNTIPPVTMGIQYNSITLTPLTTLSRFLIIASPVLSVGTSNAVLTCAAFLNNTCIGFSSVTPSAVNRPETANLNLISAPNSTSSLTFSIRIAASTGTLFVNRTSTQAGLFGNVGTNQNLTILELG
jgi:hypothetical protein